MEAQEETCYCNLPQIPQREFEAGMSPLRMEAIIVMAKKWVNGTKLKYYFFEGDQFYTPVTDPAGNPAKNPWSGNNAEKAAVTAAFEKWESIGIGLEFEETTDRLEAHFRIGFARGEGAWSYVGRDSWNIPKVQRTMNFGWDIINDQDTILHEIGHAMGMPHAHQNPNAGIQWNEEAVYTQLAGPPNFLGPK